MCIRDRCLGLPPMGAHFALGRPEGYDLDEVSLSRARQLAGDDSIQVLTMNDPVAAVDGADIVYTDVWTSMGDEDVAAIRNKAFQGYTVDAELLSKAKPSANFMHDMPVHYGEEILPGMLEHPQSVAYDQAHNRLPAQKAILEYLMTGV